MNTEVIKLGWENIFGKIPEFEDIDMVVIKMIYLEEIRVMILYMAKVVMINCMEMKVKICYMVKMVMIY